MHSEVLLLGGGWRRGGISCWRAEPAEYRKTVELESYDEREGKGESVVVSVHTWSAAMSFASGACAMLHAPARVARSSRSTGAVWAMRVLVVGCCWMGMGNGGGENVSRRGGRQECCRAVCCCWSVEPSNLLAYLLAYLLNFTYFY